MQIPVISIVRVKHGMFMLVTHDYITIKTHDTGTVSVTKHMSLVTVSDT